jgi:Cytochrome c554 and c-prime
MKRRALTLVFLVLGCTDASGGRAGTDAAATGDAGRRAGWVPSREAGVRPASDDDGAAAAPHQEALHGILDRSQIPAVFIVPGTEVGDVARGNHWSSDYCAGCHSTGVTAPYDGWKGSLMANAGRDPLFLAQLATANQDVPGVGYYCLRCHVPNSIITGTAYDPTGGSLDNYDRDGVNCHFCHTMIDPVGARAGSAQDLVDTRTLEALAQRPKHYGDAMFVLAPGGQRRGPLPPESISVPAHEVSFSPFFKRSELCGTCHDVGNPALVRQSDGSYALGALDAASADPDPERQFPLERTYTEWKLSAFANGGVDMNGKFGGDKTLIETCQDCHMPSTSGAVCNFAPSRPEIRKHEFAGSASWVLEIIALQYADDPAIDLTALARGKELADAMLKRTVELELKQRESSLAVRVINDSGHKFPTGHIEGRRGWVHVVFEAADGTRLAEYGGYDRKTAQLDERSTTVFEMHVGLSEAQAGRFGLPAGVTTHMSLADIIVKDTRIPPRGFDRERYALAGAPVVAADYQDGEHWADLEFAIPTGASAAKVTVYYQIVTAHYIEALKHGNETNHWGDTLYDLWERTDKARPTPIASKTLALAR